MKSVLTTRSMTHRAIQTIMIIAVLVGSCMPAPAFGKMIMTCGLAPSLFVNLAHHASRYDASSRIPVASYALTHSDGIAVQPCHGEEE